MNATIIRMDSWLAIATCGLCLGAIGVSGQENNAAVDANSRATNQPVAEAAEAAQVITNMSAVVEAPTARRGLRLEPIVVMGNDVELKAGDTAEAVVVLGGSAKIHGQVRDAVVVIGGDLFVDGEVGDAVTTVGGDVNIEGVVRREIVVVLGNLKLGPEAEVGRDVVVVGGKLDAAEGAHIGGHIQQLPMPKFDEFKKWFVQCVLKMRPLSLQIRWVWVVWALFTLIYLLTAVLFPRPVQASINQLNVRPATAFLVGLLANLILSIILSILAATVVGLLVVPFFIAAQVLAMIVGKTAILQYLGGRIGRPTGAEFLQRPVATFLIGTILITLLYLVPIVGLITWGVVSLWGFGAAVTAVFARSRTESTKLPASPAPPSDTAAAELAGNPEPAVASAAAGGGALLATAVSAPGTALSSPAVPVPPQAYPKAGFGIRMAAAALDMVLMCIVASIVGPFVFFVALAYFAGMWTWKGTTIGGIVLKLQVVRNDGGPMTFLVALVRALAGAFSAVALFLGFFWIGWDPDRQGWHDKIAGTSVVQLPHSVPLVCL